MRRWLRSAQLRLLMAAAGGSVLVLEGCDMNVRDTVLGGLEGASNALATTFIQAFFESLLTQDEGGPATVKAIIETAAQRVA